MSKIIGVAIKHGGLVIALPKPNRHHHVIKYMVHVLGIKAPVGHQYKNGQGFYTEEGYYFDREEARDFVTEGCISIRGVLIFNDEPSIEPDHIRELFSEDLW